MAVTVLKRPSGYILSTSPVTGVTVASSSGTARFTKTSHGLSTGNFIYLKTTVERYNGFWYVNVIDANNFQIREYATGTDVTYTVNASSIEYYTGSTEVKWSCVHLPIVYKLSSNLWPVNSADTVRTISSVTDSSGYCNITASGDIYAAGSAARYEWVKITGATDSSLNGVWQIRTYSSDTSFVLNIPYSAANDTALTGASIQYYYQNYHILVRVYGGLNANHNLQAFKPYELLTTLKLVPDASGIVTFSIAEILRAQIESANKPLADYLPNNLDFFTSFYIEYAESYDDGGTALTTFTSSFTSDRTNFEGFAVNAQLPFKNVHSGHLTDYYMNTSASTVAKFLTLFSIPLIFTSCDYQDISFCLDLPPGDNQNQVDIDSYTNSMSVKGYVNNVYGWPGTEAAWDLANSQVTLTFASLHRGANIATKTITGGFKAGVSYSFDYSVTGSGTFTGDPIVLQVRIPGSSSSVGENIGTFTSGGGTITGTVTITPLVDSNTIGLTASSNFSSGSYTLQINSFEFASSASNRSIVLRNTYYANSVEQGTTDQAVTDNGSGVYRVQVPTPSASFDRVDLSVRVDGVQVSEIKQCTIDTKCANNQIQIQWLNNLGGFDNFAFKAESAYDIDVDNSETSKTNIFPDWPKSYGEFASTIEKQTMRETTEAVLVRSQLVDLETLQALKYIKTSPVVSVVNDRYDVRTILVDSDSFTVYDEGDKTFSMSFRFRYTNMVPTQIV